MHAIKLSIHSNPTNRHGLLYSMTSGDAGSWRLRTQSKSQWGGQQHKAFLGSIRGNFSVKQHQDLTIWFVYSFTALIPKWGLRPRRVDAEVDVSWGSCFLRTFSAKQARLEVSKAKQSCQWLIRTHSRIQNTNSIHRDIGRGMLCHFDKGASTTCPLKV